MPNEQKSKGLHSRVEETPKGRPLANVSEASRRDGRKSPEYHLKRLKEEMQSLKLAKRDIEGELGAYSKSAMLKAQKDIREQYRFKDSLSAWIDKKAELDAERNKLVGRKINIDNQIDLLKPRLSTLNREISDKEYAEKGREIQDGLARIENLLQRLLVAVMGSCSPGNKDGG